MAGFDKYACYEKSVQTPDVNVEQFVQCYQDLRPGREPQTLREDFCGTFLMCCEWVKLDSSKIALGLDLDPEPLTYGVQKHFTRLKPHQKERLAIRRQDVLHPTQEKFDVIAACNFSYQVFKERDTLVRYFRSCLKSLERDGILFLDLAGGPGMIAPVKERTPVFGRNRKRRFSYVWHQRSFDPITHEALYSIHFEFPEGTVRKDVFTYDWRIYTIPELREAMLEAGFSDVAVYWETSHKGRGTGEYLRMNHGDNAYSWIAYIVGMKGATAPPLPSRTRERGKKRSSAG